MQVSVSWWARAFGLCINSLSAFLGPNVQIRLQRAWKVVQALKHALGREPCPGTSILGHTLLDTG